jgi:hypothetical protein
MIGLMDRRLSEIAPEEIAALKRQAHQARSQVARELLGAGWRWFASLVREAGVAAQLNEAPRPYLARYPVPRSRLCG